MQGEKNIKKKVLPTAMATPGLPRPRVRFKGGSEMSAADSVQWRTFPLSGQWERYILYTIYINMYTIFK